MLITLITVSCNKENQNTPSFSLKINGVPWNVGTTPSNWGGGQPLIIYYNENKGIFQIQASSDTRDKGKDERVFIIDGRNIFGEGIYNLSRDTEYANDLDDCKTWWVVDTLDNCSYLKINKIDNKANYVTGEFQFKLINPSCNNDIIKITEGKFNYNYQ